MSAGTRPLIKRWIIQWQDGKQIVVWPDAAAIGKARLDADVEHAIERGSADTTPMNSPEKGVECCNA
jgi:hypothetical protein